MGFSPTTPGVELSRHPIVAIEPGFMRTGVTRGNAKQDYFAPVVMIYVPGLALLSPVVSPVQVGQYLHHRWPCQCGLLQF